MSPPISDWNLLPGSDACSLNFSLERASSDTDPLPAKLEGLSTVLRVRTPAVVELKSSSVDSTSASVGLDSDECFSKL